jgi:hypothetical protein
VSHDPVSPVLSHDLDSVYRSSLHSVIERHEREGGRLHDPHSSSASRFTAGAAGFLNFSQVRERLEM